jgi:hypothetical protein
MLSAGGQFGPSEACTELAPAEKSIAGKQQSTQSAVDSPVPCYRLKPLTGANTLYARSTCTDRPSGDRLVRFTGQVSG